MEDALDTSKEAMLRFAEGWVDKEIDHVRSQISGYTLLARGSVGAQTELDHWLARLTQLVIIRNELINGMRDYVTFSEA